MLEFDTYEEISSIDTTWDIALVGGGSDDRSVAAKKFVDSKAAGVVIVTYDLDEMTLNAGGKTYVCSDVPEFLKSLKAKKILLDGTTLSVPVLGLIFKNLYGNKKIKATTLYVEPSSYSLSNKGGINTRDYRLSSEYVGFRGIPTLTMPSDIEDDNCIVFFLGFEGTRLKIALEELKISPRDCSLIFGLPSFKPGWETNAFNNNLKSINENDLEGRVYYCGADNPASVAFELQRIREDMGEDTKMTLIPLGSKPHSIGALLYYSVDSNCSLIFDHPIQATNRSNGVGSFHLYRVIS